MTPLLLLDIDGVLNTKDYHDSLKDPKLPWAMANPTEEDWRKLIDPDAVSRLNQIIEATGCQIILSSTWRIGYGSAPKMQALLESLGFEGEIVGETPQTFGGSRLREIRMWIRDHHEGEPYVILDDADLSYDEDIQRHWVQTYYDGAGLGDQEVQKAISILRGA